MKTTGSLRNIVPILVAAALVAGCTTIEIQPMPREPISEEDVEKLNYRLGERAEVVVGQPIVKVSQFRVAKRGATTVRANQDFVISGGEFRIAGLKGEVFEVAGTTTIDGQLHYVVPIAGYHFFVRSDGTIHESVKTEAFRWRIASKAKMEPASARLAPKEQVDVSDESEYANYELIYGGSDGQSIQVTYREYAVDDSTRPAFFQSLSYDASSEIIRYRHLVIRVLEATNQTLSYVVVSDGNS